MKTYVWVTFGDNKVCPGCVERDGKEKTMEEWQALGLPREGATPCGDLCRCDLLGMGKDDDLDELKDALKGLDAGDIAEAQQKAIEELFARVKFDKASGSATLLGQFRSVVGIESLTYETAARFNAQFNELTGLVYRYNTTVGTLPDEYYMILTIDGKLRWLREAAK